MARKSAIPEKIQLYMLIEACAQTGSRQAARAAITKYNYNTNKVNTISMFMINRKGRTKFQIIQEAVSLFDESQTTFLHKYKDLPPNEFYSGWVNNGWHANSEFIRYLLLHGRPITEPTIIEVALPNKKSGAEIMNALENIFERMEHMKEFFHIFQQHYDKAIKGRKLEELSPLLRRMVELAIREEFIKE